MSRRARRRQRRAVAAHHADRIEQYCREAFKPHRPWGRWSAVQLLDEHGHPTLVDVHVPVMPKLDRGKFEEGMDTWTGRRWAYDWQEAHPIDRHLGLLRMTPSRTDLLLPYPDATPHLHPPDRDPDVVYLGPTVIGSQPTGPLVGWNRRTSGHMGGAGATGSAKTGLERTVAMGCLLAGDDLAILDYPKGTGFRPFRDHAHLVGDDLEAAVSVLEAARQIGQGRYRTLQQEQDLNVGIEDVIAADGGRVTVLIDELGELRPRKGDRGRTKQLKEDAQDHIARLLGGHREAGVSIAGFTQQPNAEVFGGSTEARGNVKLFVSGWQEPEGARQARVPGAAHLDPEALGRFRCRYRGVEVEFQAWYLPPTGWYVHERMPVEGPRAASPSGARLRRSSLARTLRVVNARPLHGHAEAGGPDDA